MSVYSLPVVVFEDSKAIGMMFSNYLQKIGFSEVYISKTGKSGIQKFPELLKSNRTPLVFLSNLPDMAAEEIVTELFSKSPEVKIILETAHDKSGDNVRNLFAIGVSHFLPKPLRFDNLKQVVETIESEFEINRTDGMEIDFAKIKDHLIIAHRTSVTRISQSCGLQPEQVLSFLRGLVSEGDVVEMNPIREILCSQCNSVNISQIFSCPKCTYSNFKQTKLIEHYNCGTIELEEAYVDDKCPQCHKELKALGVDYRVMPNLFVCVDM